MFKRTLFISILAGSAVMASVHLANAGQPGHAPTGPFAPIGGNLVAPATFNEPAEPAGGAAEAPLNQALPLRAGQNVTDGFLVICEPGAACDAANSQNWTDIAMFWNGTAAPGAVGGLANQVCLMSGFGAEPGVIAFPLTPCTPAAVIPNAAAVSGAANVAFVNELSNPNDTIAIASYNAGGNQYYVNSDGPPLATPALPPWGVAILGLALAATGALVLRRGRRPLLAA